MNLSLLAEAVRVYRAEGAVGDFAGLKVAALAPRDEQPRLAEVQVLNDALYEPIDRAGLASLPAATLGGAYARFLDRHGLNEFNFSGKYREHFELYPVFLRYIRAHDLFHVVLGFDTSLPGELGVYSFAAHQGVLPSIRRAYRFAQVAYRFAAPLSWSELRRADERGRRAAGEASQPLIACPFEDWFERPLAEVREDLGLEASTASGP